MVGADNSLSTYRKEWLDPSWRDNKDQGGANRKSLRARLLDDLTRNGLEYAEANGFSLEKFEDEILEQSEKLVFNLECSLSYSDGDEDDSAQLWIHHPRPNYLIERNNTPYMERSSLEQISQEYLKLPFRSSLMDRLLLDVSIALELYAFGNKIFNEPQITSSLATTEPLMKRKLEWRMFLAMLGGNTLFCLALIGGLFWGFGRYPSLGLIFSIVSGIIAIWFLISTTILFVDAARTISELRRMRKETGDMLYEMDRIYAELADEGPVSPRHLLSRVQKANEMGVIWPGSLYILLEDLIARNAFIEGAKFY